jgi:uncharacterized membrane protein YedE/YeeE
MWLRGLAGGLLIGLASALYLLLNGRIAGMTAIIADVMRLKGGGAGAQSAAFLAGAFGATAAWVAVAGAPAIAVTHDAAALIASGLIVGVGVTLGNGCTSGHGVCGLSRLSPRSIVATATFMAATALSVGLLRHVFGAWF